MKATAAFGTLLSISYFNREITDTRFEAASHKCSREHELTNNILSLINSNRQFDGLQNIDVFIYDSNIPNAFACGFGKSKAAIYVSSAIIKKFDYSDSRFKAILAHELGHISGDHIILKSFKSALDTMVGFLSDTIPFLSSVEQIYELGTSFISRQIEYDADQTAVKCGFGIELIEGLSEIDPELKFHKDSYTCAISSYIGETYNSHPSLINRADAIRAYLYEQNVEYDNWYDHFTNSLSYTMKRLFSEHTNHFSQYSSMIGIMNELYSHQET